MYFVKNVAISLLILGSVFSDCVVFYGNTVYAQKTPIVRVRVYPHT